MSQLTRAEWEAKARALSIEGRAFINGEYVPASSGATFECISPIDGRLLGLVASCDAVDADLAVASARTAFDSGVWSRQARQCARQ
jgi:4-guanidinobutyraldehyde dehydrogenase/NAD-dependent aldehyde dehydrogenase